MSKPQCSGIRWEIFCQGTFLSDIWWQRFSMYYKKLKIWLLKNSINRILLVVNIIDYQRLQSVFSQFSDFIEEKMDEWQYSNHNYVNRTEIRLMLIDFSGRDIFRIIKSLKVRVRSNTIVIFCKYLDNG